MEDELYFSYPNEPIGGDNPYYRCTACKRSGPEISGRLDGHYEDCEWVAKKRRELDKIKYEYRRAKCGWWEEP